MTAQEYLANKKANPSQPKTVLPDKISDADMQKVAPPPSSDGYEAQKPKDGLFNRIAKGVVTPFARLAATNQAILEATGRTIVGDQEGANKVLNEGYEKPWLGQIKPYKIGKDVTEMVDTGSANPFNKNTLDVFASGADIASTITGGGTAAKVATNAGKQTLWQAMKAGAKTAAKEGAIEGAIGGLGQGLRREGDDMTLKGVATDIVTGGALGGTVGALTGGTLAGVGDLFTRKAAQKIDDEFASGARKLISENTDDVVDAAIPTPKPTAQGVMSAVADAQAPAPAPKLTISPKAIKAAKSAGIDERQISVIAQATPKEREIMQKMLTYAEAKKMSPTKAPRHIVPLGEALGEKIKATNAVRQEAGKGVEAAMQAMPNTPVSLATQVKSFRDELANMGIKATEDGLDFAGSSLDGPASAKERKLLEYAYTRIKDAMTPNEIRKARQALRTELERPMTEQLVGQAPSIVSRLRQSIDEPLKNLSEDYATHAQRYAEAMDALDTTYSAVGKKFKESGEDVTSLRLAELTNRLLGNAGANMEDVLERLQKFSKDDGVDLKTLAYVSNMFEDVYKLTQPNSLRGQVKSATGEAIGEATEMVTNPKGIPGKLWDKMTTITPEKRIEALKELLRGNVPTDAPGVSLTKGVTKEGVEEAYKGVKLVNSNLSDPAAAERELVTQKYAIDNYEKLKDEYLNAVDGKGKTKNAVLNADGSVKSVILNTDEWRPLFKDFGYDGTNAADIHEASSYLNNKLYNEMLAQQAGKGNKKILYLAGGGGSGKGSAVKGLIQMEDYPIIVDGVFSNFEKNVGKIDTASKKYGYTPHVVFVDRYPEDAAKGIIKRAGTLEAKGELPRTVPLAHGAKDNLVVRPTMARLKAERPDITLDIIDNNLGEGGQQMISGDRHLDFLARKGYNQDVASLEASAKQYGKELLQQGKLSERIAKAFGID